MFLSYSLHNVCTYALVGITDSSTIENSCIPDLVLINFNVTRNLDTCPKSIYDRQHTKYLYLCPHTPTF